MNNYKNNILNSTFPKSLFILLYIVYFILVLIIIQEKEFVYSTNWHRNINFIIILTAIFQILIFKLLNLKLFSIPFIFVSFSYLFHLSQQYLFSIEYDFGGFGAWVDGSRYGIYYNEAVQLSLLCIMGVFLGIILESNNKYKIVINKNRNRSRKSYKNFALMLIFTGFIFDSYIVVRRIIAMITSGYSSVHEFQAGIIQTLMSYLLVIGMFYLLLIYKNNLRKARLIAAAIIAYQFISLVTGLRAYATLIIIMVVYIYMNFINKPKRSKILIASIGGVFLLNSLTYISQVRAYGISFSKLIFGTFTNFNGLLIDIVYEFGYTINVVASMLTKVGAPTYGMSLVSSFIYAIPFNAKLFGENFITNHYTLYSLDQWTSGSSYISDLYYDFGYGAIFACVIYGILISKLSKKLIEAINTNNTFLASFLIFVNLDILYSVRSYIFRFPRKFIFTYVLLLLAFEFYERFMIKRSRKLKLEANKNIFDKVEVIK